MPNFSPREPNPKDQYKKQQIFFSFVLFLIMAVQILLTYFTGLLAIAILSLIISVILSFFISKWIYDQFYELNKKIRKGKLLTKRFQNISKYFETILQDSTDIIFSVDTEGYILKFNKGAELHFEYSQEEIVGKPLEQLFVNISDKRKILNTILRTNKSVNEEIPMKTKSGNIILLNISISEMKNDNQIIGMVVTAKDITEKKKLEMELVKKNEQLSKLAITDSLTELYNSRHFHDQIKRELSRLKRNPERKLSLVLLDLDHFKELNDTQGHQMGDQVLRSLGQVIRVCLRKDIDMGFRYGGDEFIMILPDTDKRQAAIAAERIQKQFKSFCFGKTSLSMGIVEARCEEDEQSILKRADEAMYMSKKDGRSRITFG
ncbi:MAG TPA: sensor domain-containing diguanylate cyclase [Chitinispirillaceae bacterium]|nr:sensor domain-containing diguanylate cyclase [Chitinispirillaceae bacterium]